MWHIHKAKSQGKSMNLTTKSDKSKFESRFTIALYKDENTWVAHNLELDLVGCDKDKKKALEELSALTIHHINFCLLNGLKETLLHPAPERFWKMVAEKATAQVVHELVEERLDPREAVKNSAVFEIEGNPSIAKARQTA